MGPRSESFGRVLPESSDFLKIFFALLAVGFHDHIPFCGHGGLIEILVCGAGVDFQVGEIGCALRALGDVFGLDSAGHDGDGVNPDVDGFEVFGQGRVVFGG